VTAVSFEGEGARGACRTVQSRGLQEERRQGRLIYGGYGTPAPSLRARLNPKNAANTNVVVWQDRLLALFEGGLPTELSREDLATLGETDLGGVLRAFFSAHPHALPARRAAYNFGFRIAGPPRLDIYELPQSGSARRLVTLPFDGRTMIHDFIATSRHLIFFAPPLRLRMWPQLLGKTGYSENLAWRPGEGTEVVVVPLDAPDRPVRFRVDPFYQWHFANAFEEGGKLLVDFVRLPDFTNNAYLGSLPQGGNGDIYASTCARAEIDLIGRRMQVETYSELCAEFPRINAACAGERHRFIYLAAHPRREDSRREFFSHLAKQDRETGREELLDLGAGCYPSEPVFVSRRGGRGEDDGYLLTLVYDGVRDASFVAVLDATRFSDGPIARAHFDHPIPFTFHGNFVAA
jgi:carotenoid cleavage dioxygenase-like enzyme